MLIAFSSFIQAALMGRPGGTVAIRYTVVHNPLRLLIPCHRVVLKRNDTFVAGLACKRWLVAHERRQCERHKDEDRVDLGVL